ncbi:MAG: hypothetical protein V2I79_06300 [Xanthomonadales bacterium]|jgi:type II secretory pathway pseudopilin PulG|nr:hypothetical protein [Xanthomonadales bacterium]
MTRQNKALSRSRARGITLIEILIVIGLLIVIASFAVPSMSNATASAELTAAVENIEYSIRTARNTARMEESEIMLEFSPALDGQATEISFARSNSKARALGIPNHTLPEGFFVVASPAMSFEFDARGMVHEPGYVTLTSRVDESITATVEVR